MLKIADYMSFYEEEFKLRFIEEMFEKIISDNELMNELKNLSDDYDKIGVIKQICKEYVNDSVL